MEFKNALGLSLALAACGGSRAEPVAAPAPADSAIVRPAPDPAPAPASPPAASSASEAQDPQPASNGSEPAGAGARLAFTPCEAGRPQVCTKEYRPVCGEVDNGIRCVKAPCPSTSKRTFGNACSACSDEKTAGYWPIACEKLPLDSAP